MISIIVPIYNGEKYIEDCIKSILLQEYQDWELLLIDNASTDHSLQICREFACKDDRIEVFQQHQNKGVSVARNLGIEKARGEYITFIDADDWVDKDYLERLLIVLQKKKADVVVCEYAKSYDADRKLFRNIQERKLDSDNLMMPKEEGVGNCRLKIYNTEEYLEKYFLKGNTHCWGVLFDKDLLDGIYFPKGISIGEDMLFLLEVVQNAKRIVVADYKGYFYYINESGAMNKAFTSSYMDQITCWEKALKIIEERYPSLTSRVECILVVSVLLVVGKLSELSSEKRKEYMKEENICYEVFSRYGKKKEIRRFLPAGYPLKVFIYRFFPKTYISIYGRLR